MKKALFIALATIGLVVFAKTNGLSEKEKFIADTTARTNETLNKANQDWVSGCVSATTAYVSKNRNINDGLTAEFNARNICAVASDNDQVKAALETKKNLKFEGCLNGLGMAMEMLEKYASDQKRKNVLAEYCM